MINNKNQLGKYISPRIILQEVFLEESVNTGSNTIRPGEEGAFILIDDWKDEESLDGLEGGSRW